MSDPRKTDWRAFGIRWSLTAVVIVVLALIPQSFEAFQVNQYSDAITLAIAALGLNLLTGFNGQFSLGHSAFYAIGAYVAAIAQWLPNVSSATPMIGASGAISAVIGAFALSFGQQKLLERSAGLNRTLNALWLLVAWIVLQIMSGMLAGTQGYLLATPAHIGGFVAGLLLQRPLLLWRYRTA